MSDPRIVLTEPKPLPKSEACPKCGAGPDRRGASSGFGQPHPVCLNCGHDFHGERIA